MRRKPGALVPFEQRILDIIGDREIHGSALARELGMDRRHSYAALYKALRRLEEHEVIGGRLTSRWEDPDEAERNGRPRRRLYRRQRPTPEAE